MVVPVGKKVRLLITSNDVIHGWYVPQLGINQYGIPGFVKDAWFKVDKPGRYLGQCSQICGKEHGYMPIVVDAVSAEDYAKWVPSTKAKMPPPRSPAAGRRRRAAAAAAEDPNKKWTADELKANGEKVYAANCVACHQATGKGMPPAFPPLDGSKVVHGPEGRPDRDRAEGQARHGDGVLRAALGHRPRGRHHLHAHQLGQQGRRSAAGRSEGRAQVAPAPETHTRTAESTMSTQPPTLTTPTATTRRTTTTARRAGFTRWMYTTNHKDIGTMYLWFAFFDVPRRAASMALLIRAELFQPGLQLVDPQFFNSLTTVHGLVMVFGAIMPAFVGFANWLVPMQIGAADMAFPRMNNWSFWLLIPAALLLMGSFLVPGGAAGLGLDALSRR